MSNDVITLGLRQHSFHVHTSLTRKRQNSRREMCPSGVRYFGSNGTPSLEGTRNVTCCRARGEFELTNATVCIIMRE